MIYFIRVNGDTLHNNPNNARYYVPGEPPQWPKTRFNYVDFCLEKQIVRIGWPDTGDLSLASKSGALAQGYSLSTLAPYVQKYLLGFADIETGSIVLMPDAKHSGDLYVGKVTEAYYYKHQVPDEPYECAHRLGVKWNRDEAGKPRIYSASELNISTKGGFWTRAFYPLENSANTRVLVPRIKAQMAD